MDSKELGKKAPTELDEKLLESIMGRTDIPTERPEILLAATSADVNVKSTTIDVRDELLALAKKDSKV